ncbi:MAG: hypothetical protein COB20_08095 [SAR86 cluster bacterium]|uniref:DUF4760 domain-containing protein n=1 Tax=SAR86 cluster bacterium TaxID=2030880 RepID=A0A2A4X5P8_9GAMM|nr:MAG: hypothetical protein COB20_08095 [SAR86 cluster bacterium]
MTIAELGSLGELIGSIAVIFTLIYLASQVRQGNVASLVESNQAINKKYSDFLKALYTNEVAFDVWSRGKKSYEALTVEEATKFQLIMYDAFGNWHEQWYQVECGVADDTQFYRLLAGIRTELRSLGVQEVWNIFEKYKMFDDKYIEFVREQIEWINADRET